MMIDLTNNLESWGLDEPISLPKLPQLSTAQRRVLATMVSSGTASLKALERKGLVQWVGHMWIRTPFGKHVAEAIAFECEG